jgi:hypothetical protein
MKRQAKEIDMPLKDLQTPVNKNCEPLKRKNIFKEDNKEQVN